MYFKPLTNLNSIRNFSGFAIKNYKSKVFYSYVKKTNKNNYVLNSVKNHDFPTCAFLNNYQVCYSMTSSNPNVNRKTYSTKYFISLTFGAIIGTITGFWYLKLRKNEKFESTSEVIFAYFNSLSNFYNIF